MVEFIILGIVPGTSVQITLAHVTTLAWIVFVSYLIRYSSKNTSHHEQE